jgi:hypothetical protein
MSVSDSNNRFFTQIIPQYTLYLQSLREVTHSHYQKFVY